MPLTLAILKKRLKKLLRYSLNFSAKCPLKIIRSLLAQILTPPLVLETQMTPQSHKEGSEEEEEFEFRDDTVLELIGPHGNPHRNESGEQILNLMREHDLRGASMFFEIKCLEKPQDTRPQQINHFLIPKSQLCHTVNVTRKLDSVNSDHAVLCIEFNLSNEMLLSKKNREKQRIPPQKQNQYLHPQK